MTGLHPARRPILVLVAGPNGAGPTTLVRHVPQPATGLPVVNADETTFYDNSTAQPLRPITVLDRGIARVLPVPWPAWTPEPVRRLARLNDRSELHQ